MERRVRTHAGILGISVIVVCSLAFAATAGAASTNKPYSMVICAPGQSCTSSTTPAVVSPGSASGTTPTPNNLGIEMTVTFTNQNKTGSGIQLGSDNLAVPDPAKLGVPSGTPWFSITGASPPPNPAPGVTMDPCPPQLGQQGPACFYLFDGSGNPTSSGATQIGFRNLNLAAGATSPTYTITVLTPAPSTTYCTTASPCLWKDVPKQSNDFSGTGNGLGPETNVSGTALAAAATCQKDKSCHTDLADGGGPNNVAGSISTKVESSSGTTAVNLITSLDYGAALDSSKCSGVSSLHYMYWTLSNGADNGADRSQLVSITTTPFSGYRQEFCLETNKTFTQKVIDPITGANSFPSANPTTLLDGSLGYQGLLPDCGNGKSQVNCSKLPGVRRDLTTTNSDGTTTTVAAIPPGFDARAGN